MKISLLALTTILSMRIFVTIASSVSSLQWIFEDRSYHLYYGIFLIMLTVLLKRFPKIRTVFLGVGIGLLLDDLGVVHYLVAGLPTQPMLDYWSPLFVLPLLLGISLLIFFEDYLENRKRQNHR